METNLRASDLLLQIVEREKQTIQQNNPHLSEEELHQLLNQEITRFTSLMYNGHASERHPQNSYVPRSMSYSSQHAIGLDIPNSMNRNEGLSVQSAPAAVGISRSPSSFSTTEDANPFTINACPRSMVSNWQATNDETGTAYTFGSSSAFNRKPAGLYPTMQQVSESEVPDLHVFTPSEYVNSLSDPSSASSMQSAHIPAHHDSNRLSACQSSFYTWSPSSDGPASPNTPTSGEITAESTFTSNMSRQSSFSTQLMGELSMMRLESQLSCVSDVLLEDCLPHSSPYNSISASNNDRSHFVCPTSRTINGPISENAFSPADLSFSISSKYQSGLVEDMERSTSNESNKSSSSSHSRHLRRRQEQIAHGSRPIAPKAIEKHTVAAAARQASSNHKMMRVQSQDGSSKDVAAITKAPYIRPSHPKIMCPHCNKYSNGFRGEHELRRHTERAHALIRKVWVTVDASPDKKYLTNCKQCRSGKKYGAYYNAAAHLRRAHFHPRKRGRKGKNDEKRGGKGGGDDPPMEILKQKWMKEVEIVASTDDELAVEHSDDTVSEQITSVNPESSTYLDVSPDDIDCNRSYLAPLPSHQTNDFMMNGFNDTSSFDMSYGTSQPNYVAQFAPDPVANPDDSLNTFQFDAHQSYDSFNLYMHQ